MENEYIELGIFTSIDQERANKQFFKGIQEQKIILCRNIHYVIDGFHEVCSD